MSLPEWVLQELRSALPQEAIFDGPRTGHTFDGVPVAASVRRCVVVHIAMPNHSMVTLTPSKDLARASVFIHSFALSRKEIEARQRAITMALKNRVPADSRYAWSLIEHAESRRLDPDLSLPQPLLHSVDIFSVSGFEI